MSINIMTEELLDVIAHHECIGGKPNLTAYKDSLGIWTIGYGHNIQDKPIRAERAVEIFKDDVQDAINECYHAFPWFADLELPRQHAMINLVFNMGIVRVLKFKNFLLAMSLGDYDTAVVHLRDSLWARQVQAERVQWVTRSIQGSAQV